MLIVCYNNIWVILLGYGYFDKSYYFCKVLNKVSMPKKAGVSAKVCFEYLGKYPKMPDMTLAKLIYKENRFLFSSLESCRTMVRKYRGHSGIEHRSKSTVKDFYKPLTYNTNPFTWLPDSHIEYAPVFKLPVAYKNILLISDIHIPYHNVEALKVCFGWAKGQDIDCIYINGDLLDFYNLSFHEKDLRKRPTTGEELAMARQFLEGLRKEFPRCKIYLKPANHEHRLERFLAVKFRELDLDDFKLDVLLRCGELGVEYIPRRTKVYFGHLLVEHGDRIKGSGGVSPARTLFLKYKRHAICGHFHKKTEHSAKVYDGNSIMTYSVASLCDLEPEYFEVNEHTNGFARILMDGDEFRVENFTIENGKIY